MKKLLLFFLIQSPLLQGQPGFNRAFHVFQDRAHGFVQIENIYYLASSSNQSDLDIRSVDLNGKVRNSTTLQGGGGPDVRDMIATADKKILMTGIPIGCHGPGASYFFMKLDTNGTVLWQKSYVTIDNKFNLPAVSTAEAADGTIYVAGKDSLWHLDTNGELLSVKETSIKNVTALLVISDSQFLLSGNFQNSNKHLLVDTGGVVVNQMPGGAEKYFRCSFGSIVAMNGYQIERFSLALNGSSVHPVNGGVADACVENDTIYFISANHVYHVLDTAFNTIHSVTVGTDKMTEVAISVNAGHAAILSNAVSGTYTVFVGGLGGKHAGITSFPKLQSYTYKQDIGVTYWAIDTAYINARYVDLAEINLLDVHLRLNVSVKNYGKDTIKSFYLNCHVPNHSTGFCGPLDYHEYFGAHAIAPGDSVVVVTENLSLHALKEVPGDSLPSTFTIPEINIYTTVPNAEFDANNANDARSGSLLITTITGISDIEADAVNVQIFPNPAERSILISSGDILKKIEIWTINGSRIRHEEPGKTEMEIKVEDLPAGVYAIKAYTSKGIVTRKMVKQ